MREEPEQSGRVLDGRYRVLSRLGEGGMGTVYLAEHISLGQRQAIKFLNQDLVHHPPAVKRFLQEARIVSQLNHEHIIRVFDMKHSEGVAYYVMELLDGEDLRTLLDRTRVLPWSSTRTIMLQICSALAAAHARGVVHRDLKPENCFCAPRADGTIHVKILDFGIAKVSKEAGGAHLTATGETLGTVSYMAPEQAEGRADHRSDIYALGVMMYEMLSGRLPHEGTAIEIIAKLVRGARARPLRELDPAIAPEISTLVQRAMSPDPEERFPNISALAAAISAISEHGTPEPKNLELRRSPVTTNRLLRGIAVGLVTAIAVFATGWYLLDLGEPMPNEARVRQKAATPVGAAPSTVQEDKSSAPVPLPELKQADPPPSTAPAASQPEIATSPGALQEPPSSLPTQLPTAAPPEPAPLLPAPAKTPGLTRKALISKLSTLLANCAPGFITEIVKVRATASEPGAIARLELVDAGGLRRQDQDCVKAELKGAILRLATTDALTVDITLAPR